MISGASSLCLLPSHQLLAAVFRGIFLQLHSDASPSPHKVFSISWDSAIGPQSSSSSLLFTGTCLVDVFKQKKK